MSTAEVSRIVKKLKDSGQDYEMYPSTYEMLSLIYKKMSEINHFDSVLDIGCGTCNFVKYYKKYKNTDYTGFKVFGMEKSKILIDSLDPGVFLLGTDFNETTLIDKKASIIFSNPPYSEYSDWMRRIIFEGNCNYIFLIVPSRWKDDQSINQVLDKVMAEVEVLGSFDFKNAERSARAKVDVLCIDKRYRDKDVAFDEWFDETFKMSSESDSLSKEDLEANAKNALVGGRNKIEVLVNLYQEEHNKLLNHFKAISSLDLMILKSIGVSKDGIKESLKSKISNLKNIYWEIVFNNLDEITSRLTIDSREKMLKNFAELKQVDFTHSNIYALVVYVVKNANRYYDSQLIDMFKKLSSEENVIPYKSNQSTFKYDRWRYSLKDENAQKYTLDYRIVSSSFVMQSPYSWKADLCRDTIERSIGDFCTIANNLNFSVISKEYPEKYGQKAKVYGDNGRVLFEYRTYKNRNTHFKIDKELMKAINVESSRLLGWIRCKDDIKSEFQGDLAKGSEKYFKSNSSLSIASSNILMLNSGKD